MQPRIDNGDARVVHISRRRMLHTYTHTHNARVVIVALHSCQVNALCPVCVSVECERALRKSKLIKSSVRSCTAPSSCVYVTEPSQRQLSQLSQPAHNANTNTNTARIYSTKISGISDAHAAATLPCRVQNIHTQKTTSEEPGVAFGWNFLC